MQAQFKAISISYKTAPLSIREQMSLGEAAARDFMLQIREVFGLQEALVVSTCNRTEVYYTSEGNIADKLIQLLCIKTGVENPSLISPYFQVINEPADAIRHLFYVSMGLESQVTGDIQISNQVKRAYQLSADLDMAGPFLHRLMHTIFFTNKRVVQETCFRDGAASVSYAAVELVEELTLDKKEPKILVVGLGEIGADVVRNLKSYGFTHVTITNRTASKAIELAKECDCRLVSFAETWDEVAKSDVIISAVASHKPFFDREQVANLDLLSFKVFIDLSVPRSIEKSVEEIPGVILHNVDDINNRASQALERRRGAIPQVREIIAQAMADFEDWARETVFSPTIQKFKNALEEIRKEEIARYMKHMDEQEYHKVEKITQNILNKIIKMPVLQLKAACRRGDAENLAEVLNDLFNLETDATSQKK